jgi:hypothetical protein
LNIVNWANESQQRGADGSGSVRYAVSKSASAAAADPLQEEAQRARALNAEVGLRCLRPHRQVHQREGSVIDAVRESERLLHGHVDVSCRHEPAPFGLAKLEPGRDSVLALVERWDEHEVGPQVLACVLGCHELLQVRLVDAGELEPLRELMLRKPSRQRLGRAHRECLEVRVRAARRGRQEHEPPLHGKRG